MLFQTRRLGSLFIGLLGLLIISSVILLGNWTGVDAQSSQRTTSSISSTTRPTTNQVALREMSRELTEKLDERRPQLYYDLLSSDDPAQKQLNQDPDIQLMYIDDRGHPMYYVVNNLNAAKTISTDDVWPGGSGGFSLNGSNTVLGQLGIWDGGGVLTTHQEFGGRTVQTDNPGGTHYHATHVAGTMIAAGVDPNAKGMSFAGMLSAYDWNSDGSEMAAAAADGMNVSNHSYGYITGWRYSGGDWYWWGDVDVSANEDYRFGFYYTVTEYWDEIAHNAPYYTIVKSAGNDRNDAGPGPGGGHYVWDNGSSQWVWSTVTRDPDGGTDGYDCIPYNGNAKNIITVGAVEDIPGGYTGPGDVIMSAFSGWGPTDDGRIKPDIVANGISLYSCDNDHDADYISLSGTSMSTPNVSGSINLLARHYESTHGDLTPLSSTMKAILIHTADEAGPNPGPDYMFGWGLMNTLSAAQLIDSDAVTGDTLIIEAPLADAETHTYTLTSDGVSPICLTLAWTDPPGTPPPPSLNPTTSMLANDLDLRIQHTGSSTTYYPYVLHPDTPGDPATSGDNVRDNVEQTYIQSPAPGEYAVTVSHKGTLGDTQYYSLISDQTVNGTPPQVTGVSATDDHTDNVIISWADVTDETGYRVYRDGSQIGGDLPANSTQYTDVPSLGCYDYTILAFNACGDGPLSAAVQGCRPVDRDILHVSPAGSDVTGEGSDSNPFATIQYAVHVATDSDSVVVHSGVYYENVTCAKALYFIGEDSATTVVDGSAGSYCFDIDVPRSFGAITGFTIQNSSSIGIDLVNGTASEAGSELWFIHNNRVTNHAMDGVHITGNTAVSNNYISNCDNGIVVVDGDNDIHNNICVDNGDAVYVGDGAIANVHNNTIYNIDYNGIFVHYLADSVDIQNNIIGDCDTRGICLWENEGSHATFFIDYNDLWINPVNYFGCSPGTHDIDSDPLFIGGSPFNYHLQCNSPCIDAGNPSFPLDADSSVSDIGAYPFDHASCIVGDLNCDSSVDPLDVQFLVQFVYKSLDGRCSKEACPYECGDVNCDGNIDPLDVQYLVQFVYKSQDALCDPCTP